MTQLLYQTDGYLRYRITESGVSPRALPGLEGYVHVVATDEQDEDGVLISDEFTNPHKRRRMVEKRARKMEGIHQRIAPPELEGPEDAEVTLIGWGSTYNVISEAVQKTGYELGTQVFMALDAAASEFYNADKKRYSVDGKDLTGQQLVDLYASWVQKYPICSIEDGFAEDDWDGWKMMTERLGDKIQLVGDDLFVTNTKRLQRGIDEGVANSILIKVNQIGTLTETLAAVEMAHKAGYTVVMSHRSGETEDATIADLAVATNCGQIKTGSLARSDRLAKYNQLLRVEDELGVQARYAGRAVLAG